MWKPLRGNFEDKRKRTNPKTATHEKFHLVRDAEEHFLDKQPQKRSAEVRTSKAGANG